MEDLEPVITEEEWNEFVQEFNLEPLDEPEKKSTSTLDMDDFFSRLESSNW